MLVKGISAAAGGATAARGGLRGRWTPQLQARLAHRGPWLTAARVMPARMNSTVVDRPAVYSDGVPPPPPAPAPAAARLESRPASDFQAFKQKETSSPEPVQAEAEAVEDATAASEEVNRQIFKDAVKATAPRNNWTRKEVAAIYYQPMLELAHQAVSSGPFSPFLHSASCDDTLHISHPRPC